MTVREIAGDASTRRFFRARAGRRSAVLIVHPEPLAPNAPLFSNHRILEAIGAPVPGLIDADPSRGLVLMEDLGDVTLQRHLLDTKDRRRRREAGRLYRQACDLIVLFQARAEAALAPGDFAAANALDADRFLFEMDHLHRHYVLGLRKIRLASAEERILRSFYSDLSAACDRLPRVYCHRDFQSRNLMVQEGRLRVIDFQDARMGPYTYDAVSLLRDSSLDLDEEMVQEMIEHLCGRLGLPPEEFRRDFDAMALERNLKDLGTFGYMATQRDRPEYLEYVPRTVNFVRRALLSSARHHPLYPTIERSVLA